jgi:hypothetical protein
MSLSNNTDRTPNNDDQFRSQMLIKSFHSTSADKNRHPSTCTEGSTYNEHPLHPVTTLEPAMFLDRASSFSNSMKYSGDSINRTTSPLADQPSSPIGRSFSNHNSFAMVDTLDKGLSPRQSPNITSKIELNGSTDREQESYWRRD